MSEKHKRKDARGMLSKMGYKAGGHVKNHPDEAEDKALIKKEVSKAKLKLRDGGCAEGGEVKPRADRLARGGKAHKGKKAHTTVNVVVGGQHPQPIPVPVPKPVPVPVNAGPGAPPPGASPMPMPPDGGGMPPPGLKSGGRAKSDSQRNPIKGIPEGQFKKGGRTGRSRLADGGDSGGKGGGLGIGDMTIPATIMAATQAVKALTGNRGEDFKRGGCTKSYPIQDGSGGGKGRLEKAKAYGA